MGVFILFFLSLSSFFNITSSCQLSSLSYCIKHTFGDLCQKREVEALFSLPLGQSPNFYPAIQMASGIRRRVGGGSQGRPKSLMGCDIFSSGPSHLLALLPHPISGTGSLAHQGCHGVRPPMGLLS